MTLATFRRIIAAWFLLGVVGAIAEGTARSGHWAYQPLQKVTPPAVRNVGWVRNDIDRFVLTRLEERGITPSPEADRYTLIKRLSYDLLGLPPSLDEVDAFVNPDSSGPDAYERLVDRLLQSPHFGERWGRHWLDMAHYADSDGYEKDRARPDAYLYRDWVIEAIAKDPVHINDFHATMLHLLGLNHLNLTHRFQGLDARFTGLGGKVIDEWVA